MGGRLAPEADAKWPLPSRYGRRRSRGLADSAGRYGVPVATTSARTAWAEHTAEALRRAGHRPGGARLAVVELLAEQDCCLSAQEIHDRLRERDRRVGVASVYRALDLLWSMRLVQRLEVGDGTARFEPLLPGGEHHHHVVCSRCGKVDAFEDHALEDALAGLVRRHAYAIDAHDVVLHGTCPDCRD